MHTMRVLTEGTIDSKSDWHRSAAHARRGGGGAGGSGGGSSKDMSRSKLKRYAHLFDFVDSQRGASVDFEKTLAHSEGRPLEAYDYEDPHVSKHVADAAAGSFDDVRIVETGSRRLLLMRSSADGRKRTVFLKQRHPRERVDPVTRYVSADDLVDVHVVDDGVSLQQSSGDWLADVGADENESETCVQSETADSRHNDDAINETGEPRNGHMGGAESETGGDCVTERRDVLNRTDDEAHASSSDDPSFPWI